MEVNCSSKIATRPIILWGVWSKHVDFFREICANLLAFFVEFGANLLAFFGEFGANLLAFFVEFGATFKLSLACLEQTF